MIQYSLEKPTEKTDGLGEIRIWDKLDQLHKPLVHYLLCVHVVSTNGWPHQSPPPGAGEVNTADTGYNVRRVACSLQHESQCFKYSHDDRVKDF